VGAHGPTPKDPEKRQRSKAGEAPKTDLALLPTRYAVPAAPPGLLDSSGEEWDAFWGSELGRMADPATDGPALRRLFEYRDEHARLRRAIGEDTEFEAFVKGSTGQMVMNPVYKALEALEKQILALEDRFGLNVRQRMALGAAVVDTAKSLEGLNRSRREQSNPEPRPAPLDLATSEE
jgi:terminase small subunit-like protein